MKVRGVRRNIRQSINLPHYYNINVRAHRLTTRSYPQSLFDQGVPRRRHMIQ